MNFYVDRSSPRQKITIPKSAQALSGIRIAPRLELHILDGGIVLTKAEMSAMDMVNLIAAMSNLVTDLGAQLGAVCGQCDECGYYTAQDLYDNWTGSKGKSMPSSLPALALWKRNGGAGHTGIVEKKDGSNYFYSDHNGLDGGNDGYGDRTTDDVPGLFTNFIGYCY